MRVHIPVFSIHCFVLYYEISEVTNVISTFLHPGKISSSNEREGHCKSVYLTVQKLHRDKFYTRTSNGERSLTNVWQSIYSDGVGVCRFFSVKIKPQILCQRLAGGYTWQIPHTKGVWMTLWWSSAGQKRSCPFAFCLFIR